jgi:hypothetical protein
MPLAAGAEGAAGRGAHARFVDELKRKRARIGESVDREEELERRIRLEEARAPGFREPLA